MGGSALWSHTVRSTRKTRKTRGRCGSHGRHVSNARIPFNM
jgi:hypothetical protein